MIPSKQLPSFSRVPNAMAEKYSDDGGVPPKYARQWEAAAKERRYRRRTEIAAVLGLGVGAGYGLQVLPIYVWGAVVAACVASAATFGVISIKNALARMQMFTPIKMVDPLPDDHPSVYVVDTRPKPPSKKNGVETQP